MHPKIHMLDETSNNSNQKKDILIDILKDGSGKCSVAIVTTILSSES